MKIEAYLANIEKNGTKIIDILEEKYYEKGTNLDIENLSIPTYYGVKRNKDDNFKYYNLIFKVVCENIQNIKLAYVKEGTTGKELERVTYKNEEYFVERVNEQESKVSKDFATIGYETLEVIDKRNNEVLKSIDIEIFSNAIDYNQYIDIINDLIRIKKDIIYQGDKKGYIGKNLINKGEEEYLKEVKNIYSLAKRIFNKPKTALGKENIYKNVNNIKKVTPKLLIDKEINPYKNKYLVQKGKDDINIYENRMIKYALEKILLTLKNHKYGENIDIKNFEREIIKYKEKISEKDRIAHKSLNNCLKIKDEEINNNSEDKHYIFYIKVNGDSGYVTKEEKESYINLSYDTDTQMFKISMKRDFNKGKSNKNLYIFSDEWGNNLKYYESYYCENEKKINTDTKYFRFYYKSKNPEKIKNIYDILINSPNNALIKFDFDGQIDEKPKIGKCRNFSFIPKKIIDIEVNNEKQDLSLSCENIEDIKPFLEKFDESILPLYAVENEKILKEKFENKKLQIEKVNIEEFSKNIKKLISKEELMEIKTKKEVLKNTQIFNADPNYNKIFRAIKKLDKKINFLSDISPDKYFLKTGPDIYEFWCYYKMIYILVYEMGWKINGERDVSKEIADVLEGKKESENVKKAISLYHEISENEYIYLDISYEIKIPKRREFQKVKEAEIEYFKPDYQFKFKNSSGEILGIFYLDAKFKNFKDMGENMLKNNIEDVSICKYYKMINDNNVKASFIIHPIEDNKYITFGGRHLYTFGKNNDEDKKKHPWKAEFLTLDEYISSNKREYEIANHKFGAFCLTPYNTDYFKIFMKMILEYHLKKYEICWKCGNIHPKKVKLLTAGGKEKYRYNCDRCGEFWIKSHCSGEGHMLIKHIDNYHNNKDNEIYNRNWYIVCPKCFDGDKNKSIFNKKVEYMIVQEDLNKRTNEIIFNTNEPTFNPD